MGITSLVGGIITGKKKKKAAKRQARAEQARVAAEREQQRISQVRADVETRRERSQQLREARIRRAQIIQGAVSSGAGLGGSTAQGAIGGINTQFGANQGRLNQALTFSGAISEQSELAAGASSEIARQQGKINVANAQNEVFQAIGGLEKSVFDRAGGFTSLFGGNK